MSRNNRHRNRNYKENIQLNINSDTTIIGIDENSGIKGVALSISSKNNIINLLFLLKKFFFYRMVTILLHITNLVMGLMHNLTSSVFKAHLKIFGLTIVP